MCTIYIAAGRGYTQCNLMSLVVKFQFSRKRSLFSVDFCCIQKIYYNVSYVLIEFCCLEVQQ